MANAGRRQDDTDHRFQSVAGAFHANKNFFAAKWFQRLIFFDVMITSVVCFAAGHRKSSYKPS